MKCHWAYKFYELHDSGILEVNFKKLCFVTPYLRMLYIIRHDQRELQLWAVYKVHSGWRQISFIWSFRCVNILFIGDGSFPYVFIIFQLISNHLQSIFIHNVFFLKYPKKDDVCSISTVIFLYLDISLLKYSIWTKFSCT